MARLYQAPTSDSDIFHKAIRDVEGKDGGTGSYASASLLTSQLPMPESGSPDNYPGGRASATSRHSGESRFVGPRNP